MSLALSKIEQRSRRLPIALADTMKPASALWVSIVGSVALAAAAFKGPVRAAESADVDWVDWDALATGEVVVSRREVALDLAVLIDAEWSSIWNILTECELTPQYVPDVIDCRLLEEVDGGVARVFVQTVKPIFFLPKFEHVFRLSYFPPERVTLTSVAGGGFIETMNGEWLIVPRPGGKIAVIESMVVTPAPQIPKVLVRAALKRNLVQVLAAVKTRAEGAAPGRR
jgi:hypothetical protein